MSCVHVMTCFEVSKCLKKAIWGPNAIKLEEKVETYKPKRKRHDIKIDNKLLLENFSKHKISPER